MNKHLPTVSVGITAFNEENSFPSILTSIVLQNQRLFNLEHIYVISDGSTDSTVLNAQRITDTRIEVIKSTHRKGKPFRLNQLCKMSKSDILVLLDADIIISDPLLIEKLIKPLILDENIAGVSGAIAPAKPITFTQKVVFAGTQLWDKVRQNANAGDLYYCTGAVRAFRKSLSQEIEFPNVSTDDVYPYLYCKSKGHKFNIKRNALVEYRLPSTYYDFYIQMRRYLMSKSVNKQIFDDSLISNTYSISVATKIVTLLHEFMIHPVLIFCYLLFVIPPHLNALIFKSKYDTSLWKMAHTTK